MLILLIIILAIIAFINGSSICDYSEISVELHNFKHPYFNLGPSYRQHILDNGLEIRQLIIGLLFVNIVIDFFKLPKK